MVRVALTGGIATGKSTVLRRLAAAGLPTIDADALARSAVAPGTPGLDAIRRRFGPSVVDSSGALDRRALAALVFDDAKARADLEAIIHPVVYRAIQDWFQSLPPETPAAVADIPLLFETGHERDFDLVLVAACSTDDQRQRMAARDGLTRVEADARLAAQWPIDTKVARADRVIWTTGPRADTERQIDRLARELLGR